MDRYDALNAAIAGEAYRNADVVAGIEGSEPNALAFEGTMMEIVHAISALGLVPSNATWNQLGQAIIAYVAAQVATSAAGKVSKAGDTMTGPLNIGAGGTPQLFLRNSDNNNGAGASHATLQRGTGAGKTVLFVSGGDGANGINLFELRMQNGVSISAQFQFKESGTLSVGADPVAALDVSTKQYVDQRLFPTGTILWVPSTSAPSGSVKANGSLLSRTTYAALWAYAQASGNISATDGAWAAGQFSPGDGVTTFRVPDLRGEFIRGWDNGRGVDSGRAIGTWQADDLKSHTHTYTAPNNTVGNGADQGSAGNKALPVAGLITGATGGAETRPRNVALLGCIKY